MSEIEPNCINLDHLPPSLSFVPPEFIDNDTELLQEAFKEYQETVGFDVLGLKSLKRIIKLTKN